MGDENEAEAAAARLEMALDRIAALAARPVVLSAAPMPQAVGPQAVGPQAVANPAASADYPAMDVAALSGRLDALIAELRGALAG